MAGWCSLLLWGCTHTFYEPAICIREKVDTVAVINNYQYVTYHECEVWQALSDSTKRWDNEGNRLP